MTDSVKSTPNAQKQHRRYRRQVQHDAVLGDVIICTPCKTLKPVSEFYRDPRQSSGYAGKCKSCEQKYAKDRQAGLTPELKKRRYDSFIRHTRHSTRARANGILNGTRQRSKRSGRENDLDIDFVQKKLESGRCEATGIKFQYKQVIDGVPGATPFSPSIDRVNSKGGYTKDNSQMVCSIYNTGKMHHDETDFIAFCMVVALRNQKNEAALIKMIELMG